MVNIKALVHGDRVQGDFLVLDRTERSTSAGDPFIVLTLGNNSGRIDTAPIWSNQLVWAEGADRGKIVQAIGQISNYNRNGASKRQLAVSAPLRVLPTDQFDISGFLPTADADIAKLWDWVDKTRSEVQSATLRRVLDCIFGNDEFRLRFEKTPGSVRAHHACLGGLLLHVYEVTTIARTAGKTAKANLDIVTAGALLHDIGKVEAYSVSSSGFGYTPSGMLIGHVVLGCLMLDRELSRAEGVVCSEGQKMELQHIILSHHGALEFGSPVQPMTLEAEIVHWADEASAKSNDMVEALDDSELFPEGSEVSIKKSWRLDRKLWRRSHTWD